MGEAPYSGSCKEQEWQTDWRVSYENLSDDPSNSDVKSKSSGTEEDSKNVRILHNGSAERTQFRHYNQLFRCY